MSAHGRRQGGRVCVCVCGGMDRGLGRMRGKPQESGTTVALLESPPRKQCEKRKLLRVCVWAWRALRRDLRRQAQSQGGGGEAEGCPDARGFWGPTHILRPAGKRLGNGRLPSPRRSSQNSHNMIRSNYFSIKGYFGSPSTFLGLKYFHLRSSSFSSYSRLSHTNTSTALIPPPSGKGKDKQAISLR